MPTDPWEWLFGVGSWGEPLAPSVAVFVVTAVLFYVISLLVRHAIETRPDADPSVALHRGRIATAVVMVIGLLVAAQASGLFRGVNIVPAGISLIGTALHIGGIIAAAALIAAGLAAGLGAKDVVASAVLGVYLRSKWGKEHALPEVGDRITIGDTEGELTRVSPLYVHIRTYDGATVLLPMARAIAHGIRQPPAEPEPADAAQPGEPSPLSEPPPAEPAAPDERRSIFD
ncbi:MAG: mechanosensitive ion channel [Armatimonadota bacterium]